MQKKKATTKAATPNTCISAEFTARLPHIRQRMAHWLMAICTSVSRMLGGV